MSDCVFCEIVAGRSPVSAFYEDEIVLGLAPLRPVNAGHGMIIPKAHAAELADLPEETGRHLFSVARRAASAIRASGLRCEGINLFLADGEAAGQEVFHVHLHVIPRFRGDTFRIEGDFSPKPREELDGMAARIRAAWPEIGA